MKLSDNRIRELKEQKERLSAKIQSMEARFRSQQRKDDTRKKILVGAYYLDKHQSEQTINALLPELDKYLTRDSDRALFDLNPVNKQ